MIPPSIDCTTCPYFQPFTPRLPEEGGICRSHPPTPVMVGVHKVTGRPIIEAHYPAVGPRHWCGEHPSAKVMVAMGSMRTSGPVEPLRANGSAEEPEEKAN
jgi:hypothetical protein